MSHPFYCSIDWGVPHARINVCVQKGKVPGLLQAPGSHCKCPRPEVGTLLSVPLSVPSAEHPPHRMESEHLLVSS